MQTDEIRGARAQERLRMSTAKVVDHETSEVRGLIVLSWQARIVVIALGLMLLAMLGLVFVVYNNNSKINQLEIKVDEGNTSNSNR